MLGSMRVLHSVLSVSSLLLVGCPDGGSGATTGTDGAGATGDSSGAAATSSTDATTTGNTSDAPTTGDVTTTTGTASTTDDGTTGDGTTGEPADESVTLRDAPCEKSPPAATRCESYEVVCAGLPPAVVDVAVYEAAMGVPSRGSIVFGSGGDGTGFYNFSQAKALVEAGYTLLDRRWPAGWFTGADDGPQQAACRLAALVRHFRATPPAAGPLCATGNSGGSAELTYALTWQGAGAALDFALPTSGPFHRLDLACQGAADPDWPGECEALRSMTCPDCASQTCQLGNGPRTLMDVAFADTPRCSAPGPGDLELLEQRSPALGPDLADLAGARVQLLIGEDDPGAYAPLATALFNALADAGVDAGIDYVADAPHEMDTTQAGADAIRDALLASCVP